MQFYLFPVWLEAMVPLLELRNYTSFVAGYLKNIVISCPENRRVTVEQFCAVMDIIHSSPSSVRQDLLAVSPQLRVSTLPVFPYKITSAFLIMSSTPLGGERYEDRNKNEDDS